MVSKPRFEDSGPTLTKSCQKPSFWETSSGVRLGRCLAGAVFFSKFWIFPDLVFFFNILKSGDSEPGTPLERSGSKFCAKCRARELRSIYGDPFHEDFVPDDGSGPGSHTFPARCAGVRAAAAAAVREQLQPH